MQALTVEELAKNADAGTGVLVAEGHWDYLRMGLTKDVQAPDFTQWNFTSLANIAYIGLRCPERDIQQMCFQLLERFFAWKDANTS